MAFERELREALDRRPAGRGLRPAASTRRSSRSRTRPRASAPTSITGRRNSSSATCATAFPDDGLVAEERTPTLAGSPTGADRVWVVDPIDGTRGFAMKNGEFSVMVGLTVGGRPVVGVVLEPVSGRVTYAAVGSGCWVVTEGGEPRAVPRHGPGGPGGIDPGAELVEAGQAAEAGGDGPPPGAGGRDVFGRAEAGDRGARRGGRCTSTTTRTSTTGTSAPATF